MFMLRRMLLAPLVHDFVEMRPTFRLLIVYLPSCTSCRLLHVTMQTIGRLIYIIIHITVHLGQCLPQCMHRTVTYYYTLAD